MKETAPTQSVESPLEIKETAPTPRVESPLEMKETAPIPSVKSLLEMKETAPTPSVKSPLEMKEAAFTAGLRSNDVAVDKLRIFCEILCWPPPVYDFHLEKEVFGYYPPTRISEEIAQPQMNVNFVESASAMASAFMKPHQELKELKGDWRYSPTDSYSANSSTFNRPSNHIRHPSWSSFPSASYLVNQDKRLKTYPNTVSQWSQETEEHNGSALSNLRNQLQGGSKKRTSPSSLNEEYSDAPLLSRLSQTKPQGVHPEIKRSRLAAGSIEDKPIEDTLKIGVQVSSRPKIQRVSHVTSRSKRNGSACFSGGGKSPS